jgi:hypothetical protein
MSALCVFVCAQADIKKRQQRRKQREQSEKRQLQKKRAEGERGGQLASTTGLTEEEIRDIKARREKVDLNGACWGW